ncbi:hypothetical protein ACMA1D_08045 [Streptomyces sp. 796.1]|uniref:hypothetical protein n=1 Tax=Streptomyces sp. 796.1 TaxID=3163029 RepID=UPI0039C9EDD8
MQHRMTIRVYRKRPGERNSRGRGAVTVVSVESAEALRADLASLTSTVWPACRCPQHRARSGGAA